MSKTTIAISINVGGLPTDPTSIVFRDTGGTYGVKRADTDASVVAIDTALSQTSTGRYAYTFTDPAANLTYDYSIQYVINGETYHRAGTIQGGTSTSENLYDLLPMVTPYLPGCPDTIIKQNLRRALREFANKTWAIEEEITVTGVADQREYTIPSTYDAHIKRVKDIKINDCSVDYTMEAPNIVKLWSAPTAGESIVCTCALLPEEDAAGTVQAVIDEWGDGIASGALYLLFNMEKTAWFSPHNANERRWEFTRALRDAKRAMWSDRLSDDRMAPGEVV